MRLFFSKSKVFLILLVMGFWLSSWGLLGHIHTDKLAHAQCQTCVSQAQLGTVLLQAAPASFDFNQIVLNAVLPCLTARQSSFISPYFQRGPPAFTFFQA